MKSLVIVPTYNEAENIVLLIEALLFLPQDFHVLVVDDNSPDGTAELVKNNTTNYLKKTFVLEREKKEGLGRAYIAGFNWAIENKYDLIFEMDADFSHNPEHLPRLYNKLMEGFDVAIGSRNIKKGKIMNWPWDRRLLSWGASIYSRLITGMPVKDATAGFVGYKRPVLENIDLKKIKSLGYAFQIEMKFAAYTLGYKLAEVPITFIDRIRGTSKMNSSIIKEAAFGVFKMRLYKLQGKSYGKANSISNKSSS